VTGRLAVGAAGCTEAVGEVTEVFDGVFTETGVDVDDGSEEFCAVLFVGAVCSFEDSVFDIREFTALSSSSKSSSFIY
jgi:hypothetical protein